MRLASACALLLAPALVTAQPAPRTVEITLSSFKYTPPEVTLEHGRPYVLHFVNSANGGHDFVAKEFFAAGTLSDADRKRLGDGEIELKGGASADVSFVAPAPGRYPFHCSHFMHSTFGMKGALLVR